MQQLAAAAVKLVVARDLLRALITAAIAAALLGLGFALAPVTGPAAAAFISALLAVGVTALLAAAAHRRSR